MKYLFRSGKFWCAFASVAVVAVSVITFIFWGWLHGEEDSPAATIRNIGLVFFGVLAGILATWRSVVADRQSKAAQRQANTAHHGFLNECYQKGTDMLGSPVLSVRLGGIYSLDRLAKDHAEDYHIQIMCLFSACICHPPKDEWEDNTARNEKVQKNADELQSPDFKLREDIQALMECLGDRSEERRELEDRQGYALELFNADLSGARLMGADLSGAALWDANLSHAYLVRANLFAVTLLDADLSYANLGHATLISTDLSGARLFGANLSGANLSGANLSYSDFVGAELPKGLTQDQLDRAVADPDNPPILTNVKDHTTGKPLVWRGGPITE